MKRFFDIAVMHKQIIICVVCSIILGVLIALGHNFYNKSVDLCTEDMLFMTELMTQSNEKNAEENEQKVAYLTFDDGPSKNTENVLAVLREYDVKATFFVVTSEDHEDWFHLLSDIEKDGHVIGLHSHSHRYSSIYSDVDSFWEDIEIQRTILLQYVSEVQNIVRFPGGSSNTVSRNYGGSDIMKKLIDSVEENNHVVVDWNVSAEDATGNKIYSGEITNNVLKGAKDKDTAIILMHDAKDNAETVKALGGIIEGMIAQGFIFDTLPIA